MKVEFKEVPIPDTVLSRLEAEPASSLEQLGLLELINKEAQQGFRPVWEMFLKTRFIIFEKILE